MKYLNLHTHNYSKNENILEIVNQFPNQFNEEIPIFSIGIHPWHINENSINEELLFIKKKIILENCFAIGECGLDKKIKIPIKIQIEVFKKQLLLANEFKKPVIIHCVGAFQEIIKIKKDLNITVPAIIHGFSKNETVAKDLVKNGFYISFGKYLFENPLLKNVFHKIPNDSFFLETDSSHQKIEAVYNLAAAYKNISIDDVKKNIENNFKKVFKISL